MGILDGRKYVKEKKVPFMYLSMEELVEFKIDGISPQLDLDFLGSFFIEARDRRHEVTTILEALNRGGRAHPRETGNPSCKGGEETGCC